MTQREWTAFVDGLASLDTIVTEGLSTAERLCAECDGDVSVEDWMAASQEWTLRLDGDITIKNHTMEAQVRAIERQFQAWTIDVQLCTSMYPGAHPMDALSKHHRLYTAVDTLTSRIVASVETQPPTMLATAGIEVEGPSPVSRNSNEVIFSSYIYRTTVAQRIVAMAI
eukprot:m.630032 g.630032  ORF g.630032 m.630032 type:complete len:169 (+) comp22564_c2_seq7:631-1137(+)